jgi:indole-3-glycerol phosphate synthase
MARPARCRSSRTCLTARLAALVVVSAFSLSSCFRVGPLTSASSTRVRRRSPGGTAVVVMAGGKASKDPRTDELLLQMIERKKYEVSRTLDEHKGIGDPLTQRLGFVSETSSYRLTRALRRGALGETRRLSVLADMKRLSPTASANMPRTVAGFVDAGRRAQEIAAQGVSVVMVSTDEMGWGGKLDDLSDVLATTKAARKGELTPSGEEQRDVAVVMKDLIIHPIQIAEAVERGADGVLLMANVVGQQLEELMNAATIMGTEAIVEVHTPNECQHALELGASIIMVNNWDRADGSWHPEQAAEVRGLIPDNVVTIATGGIGSSEQAALLADAGFDCVGLGRALAVHPEPKKLVQNIRAVEAMPAIAGWNGPE